MLKLSWNDLHERGARAIAASLGGNAALEELHLSKNAICDAGGSHLARAMEANTSLKLVDLSSNHLGYDTCLVLEETLQVNQTLQTLIMRENPLGSTGAKALLHAAHMGERARRSPAWRSRRRCAPATLAPHLFCARVSCAAMRSVRSLPLQAPFCHRSDAHRLPQSLSPP